MMHGNGDKLTSCAATKKFYNAVRSRRSNVDRTLSLIPNGTHELHNNPLSMDEVCTEIADWVDRAQSSWSAEAEDVQYRKHLQDRVLEHRGPSDLYLLLSLLFVLVTTPL